MTMSYRATLSLFLETILEQSWGSVERMKVYSPFLTKAIKKDLLSIYMTIYPWYCIPDAAIIIEIHALESFLFFSDKWEIIGGFRICCNEYSIYEDVLTWEFFLSI